MFPGTSGEGDPGTGTLVPLTTPTRDVGEDGVWSEYSQSFRVLTILTRDDPGCRPTPATLDRPLVWDDSSTTKLEGDPE